MAEVRSFKEFITDMLHNMHEGCYNFTKNGECSKCGNCCSTLLPLKSSEIEKLKRIIKTRNLKPHEQPRVLRTEPMFDLTCPFLTDEHECSIYDDRPYICRIFKCDTRPSISDIAMINEPMESTNLRDLF